MLKEEERGGLLKAAIKLKYWLLNKLYSWEKKRLERKLDRDFLDMALFIANWHNVENIYLTGGTITHTFSNGMEFTISNKKEVDSRKLDLDKLLGGNNGRSRI